MDPGGVVSLGATSLVTGDWGLGGREITAVVSCLVCCWECNVQVGGAACCPSSSIFHAAQAAVSCLVCCLSFLIADRYRGELSVFYWGVNSCSGIALVHGSEC